MLTGGLLLALCCLSVPKVPEEFNCGSGDVSEVLCDEEWRVGGGLGLCLVGFVCVGWAGGCFPSLLPMVFSYCCSYEGNGNTQQLKPTVTNYHIWETTVWWLLVLLVGFVFVCGVFSCVFCLRL